MPLEDEFERPVTGIRVSLTDRCNFDCVYCHNEGLGDTRGPLAPRDGEMEAEAVVRLLEVVSEFDVDSVTFTGGEPMLREDLETIVQETPESMETSITTNGTFLPDRAADLAAAGLDRVKISQDALDPEAFARLTKSGAYDVVLDGVEAALDAGLTPAKLNMVVFEPTAGYIPEMIEFVQERDGLQLQLIEYMPEIAGHPEWAIDIDEVHDWLARQADDVHYREDHDRSRYEIGDGTVEVVDPVGNEDFCANCHRVRVTPDGKLKGCLNRTDDYRSMGEMTREEIRRAFRETVRNRVPYYGEYLVERDGEWVQNEAYLPMEMPSPAADD